MCISIMRRAILWPIRWALGMIAMRLGRRNEHDGILLVDTTSPELDQGAIRRVQKALALLRDLDLKRYEQLRREMPHLLIVNDDRVEYARVIRAGFVSRRLIESRPAVTIATTLVGLAARARASNRPSGWLLDVTAKPRLIRLDCREQARFVSRLDSTRFSGLDDYMSYLQSLVEETKK